MQNIEDTITGADEVGRGCFAGPIVAACVTLPKNLKSSLLTDSKSLSKSDRRNSEYFVYQNAIQTSIKEYSAEEIDEHGIDFCNFESIKNCIRSLSVRPEKVWIDGNRFPISEDLSDIRFETVVKGDSKISAISAASIIAKQYRDRLMKKLHEKYPVYGWHTNVGYGSQKHMNAIKKFGLTPFHRKTFIHFLD